MSVDIRKLPDSKTYINRMEYISPRSGESYVISQRRSDRVWCCACWPWRKHRICDHLQDLGLGPSSKTPVEEVIEAIGRLRFQAQQIRGNAGVPAKQPSAVQAKPPRQVITKPAVASPVPPKPSPVAPKFSATISVCETIADEVVNVLLQGSFDHDLTEQGAAFVLFRAAQKMKDRLTTRPSNKEKT